MKKQRLFISFLLCIAVTFSSVTAFAHERNEHDRDINLVLFGDEYYKNSHPNVSEVIEALEDATYLAVDQFNGKGQDALNYLNSRKIPGIPSSIAEIDFKDNYHHRAWTHKGWNYLYDDIALWDMRKTIIINTVEKELFINDDTPLSWFPWLSELFYGRNGTEKQQESFCILLYYIHIIGDNIDAEDFQDLKYIAALVELHDSNSSGIIPELLICLDSLFEDQKNTFVYSGMIQEIVSLQEKCEVFLQSANEIDSKEEFEVYNSYANNLMDILENDVHLLLKNELFFKKCFY